MKKTLTTLFLLITTVCFGQSKQKWRAAGYSEYKDTLTKSYQLQGKDSLTYTIETQNCNCDFYTSVGDHKTHPCKGLRLHSIEVHFMYWTKDVTFVKGIKISETSPYWGSSLSQMSMIDGEYEQNGKMVYVAKIHLLKHKLINRTQPYKFESEWVTLNEY